MAPVRRQTALGPLWTVFSPLTDPARMSHDSPMQSLPIPDGSLCTYCGGIAHAWDHVIPVQLLRPDSKQNRIVSDDWLVLACNECNGALSDRMLHNVPLRAKWLYNRYRRKYSKLMSNATWTDDELDELSGSFKLLVIETMLVQAELDHRLAHLRKIAEMPSDYLQPKPHSY